MSLSRRQAIALIGGGTVFGATAAAGGFYFATRTPNAALAPWEAAGGYSEPRRRALSYAILSPNPHNRQPWMVDLSQDGRLHLHVDTDRLLPHTDPFSRQIVIGLGCFLETLQMAARQDGYSTRIALFPEGSDPDRLDGRPVATVTFDRQADLTPDPLFAHLMQRRSQKEPFDLARPVPDDAIARMLGAAQHGTALGATNDPDRVQDLRRLSGEALMIEIETPHTYRESVDLFRIGKAEVNASPDGIDFTGPMFDTLRLFGLFTRQTATDTDSMAYATGVDSVMENTRTAMAHLWMTTPGNSRAEQIAAGRDWMRVHLAATGLGVAMQPLSQALQEDPEMAARYAEIHEKLAPDGGTLQMFARLGYCAPVPRSPRWPLEKKIMNA